MDITNDIKECDAFVFLTKIVSEMNDTFCAVSGSTAFSISYLPDASGVYFDILFRGESVKTYFPPADDTEVGRKVFLQDLEKELDSLFDDAAKTLKGCLNAKNLVKNLNKKVAQ